MTGLLAHATPEAATRLLEAARGRQPRKLDQQLWGSEPSREEAPEGVLANLRLQFQARHELEDVSVSRSEAAHLLGTSEQAVTDQLEARRLLGLKRGRRWLIPAWQLHPETERGVLPGLDRLAAAFPGGVVALSSWATKVSPDLDGRTPRQALAEGTVDPVISLARNLTAAGW